MRAKRHLWKAEYADCGINILEEEFPLGFLSFTGMFYSHVEPTCGFFQHDLAGIQHRPSYFHSKMWM